VPAAGTYTLQLVDNSSDLAVPGFTATSQIPRSHYANLQLALKDSSGNVLAQNTTASRPKTLTANVSAGQYRLEVTPISGWGTAHLGATYVGGESIAYDAHNHATTVDDGSTTVVDTLAPDGRVLRRVVTPDGASTATSDTTYGYDSDSDSPAYSYPTAGGALSTYIDSPLGLLLTDVAGTPTYTVLNGHGDVVGTTDAAGNYTANPSTDEFGVGTAPASGLGYLGADQRSSIPNGLGLIRMGVRLYDPRLGRFLEVDPVPGAGLNDYDYGKEDPVNAADPSGDCAPWDCIKDALGWVADHAHQIAAFCGGVGFFLQEVPGVNVALDVCAIAGNVVAGGRAMSQGKTGEAFADWFFAAADLGARGLPAAMRGARMDGQRLSRVVQTTSFIGETTLTKKIERNLEMDPSAQATYAVYGYVDIPDGINAFLKAWNEMDYGSDPRQGPIRSS
jgi:RHS repeat-associated protein